MNKELVKTVLNKLLELPHNAPMPQGSGVCLELGIAAVQPTPDTRKELMALAEDTDEYIWCYDKCVKMYDSSCCDYNNLGNMTTRRRQFVLELLRSEDLQ